MVFPARAGMNRSSGLTLRLERSVPRASGDEPQRALAEARLAKCSPRERG